MVFTPGADIPLFCTLWIMANISEEDGGFSPSSLSAILDRESFGICMTVIILT